FEAVQPESEKTKIMIASMYLTDDAKLWWRTRCENVEFREMTVQTWEDFKRELMAQFMPQNDDFAARGQLRRLKQAGSIRDYIKTFSTLLEITEMSEKDQLYEFLEGLEPWLQIELQKQQVKNVYTAMATAERLCDYSSLNNRGKIPQNVSQAPQKSANAGTSNKFGNNHTRSGSEPSNNYGGGTYKPPQSSASSAGSSVSKAPYRSPQWVPPQCFFCRSKQHITANCDQKEALNAIACEYMAKKAEEREREEANMGSLHLCAAVASQVVEPTTAKKGLLYVSLIIKGDTSPAMIDTGATHNFLAIEEAKRLGLPIEKRSSTMKAVNSAAKPVHGIVNNVPITMDSWSGKTSFLVVDLDDFKVIMGLEFLDQHKVVLLSYVDSMLIGGENPIMI
ncbi:retropepsin-like aspartic protease family protein, partial [Zoogloea oryzae]|uniref:retropepsin-like aspartic protease family protein n=1 Tax=Zoogloea oryzae TaxID=310767 RepID=UPI0024E0A485